MTWMEWYGSLAKPSWTPAPSTISLIWALLDPAILVSFGFVFVRASQGYRPHEAWPRTPEGELAMFTRRLDLNGLLKEVESVPDAPKGDEGRRDL